MLQSPPPPRYPPKYCPSSRPKRCALFSFPRPLALTVSGCFSIPLQSQHANSYRVDEELRGERLYVDPGVSTRFVKVLGLVVCVGAIGTLVMRNAMLWVTENISEQPWLSDDREDFFALQSSQHYILNSTFNEGKPSVQYNLHYSSKDLCSVNRRSTWVFMWYSLPRTPDLKRTIHLRPFCSSPCLPHLLSESNQPIEKLFSESDGGKLLLTPIFVNDQKTVSDLSISRPSDNQLRLPSKPTNFLDFLDSKSDI